MSRGGLSPNENEETFASNDNNNFYWSSGRYCAPKRLENILMTDELKVCLTELLKSLLMVQFLPSKPGTQAQA